MRDLTMRERMIVAICRYNDQTSPLTYINKKFKLGPAKVHIEFRSKKNLWGRFGGGWNWELGFQASKTTLILNLLVLSIRLSIYDWLKKRKEQNES